MSSSASLTIIYTIWLVVLSAFGVALPEEPIYVVATVDGQQMLVRDDRQPSLYTLDYEDCLGNGDINITQFGAAYYRDNMTINFHLSGETDLKNESIMMQIGIYAYGESRYDLAFDPCSAYIPSACPLKAGIALEAAGRISVSQAQASSIPDLALNIPDFEGQAIFRIFSNSTRTEIGCFTAQITNGNTFQQKTIVSPTLATFTFLTILSSFATTVYGDDPVVMRKHYAHSLSVLVVFSVWHHIFYSGALSVNWPSVLVAFWSNYAWAGGMIYSENMQNTINSFTGANKGNTSVVGAAGTGMKDPTLGGGYKIQQIYKRSISNPMRAMTIVAKRDSIESTNGFTFSGQPVKAGLPMPGNYSGFAGTLAPERIPASNAFMTGLIWFLILIVSIIGCILAFKLTLEVLRKVGFVKKNQFDLFRAHYLRYMGVTLLRTITIGFFMMAFLTMFQFSYLAWRGPVSIACLIFIGIVLGLGSLGGLASYQRIRSIKSVFEADRLNFERKKVLKVLPWCRISRESQSPHSEDKIYLGSIPWLTIHSVNGAEPIQCCTRYIRDFGWLAARYRRTRWWFFIIWILYEFIRACLMAGASRQPRIQVFGLFGVELIAFVAMILLRPFEGQRMNVLVNYLLGFSKVATVGLSALFLERFSLPRILATMIGFAIIIIQGLLTITVVIAIIIGAITSYMSVMRNRETIRPKRWNQMRNRYFEYMDFTTQDIPRPPSSANNPMVDAPKSPYFSVMHVKRLAKVEDEDHQFMQEISDTSSGLQLPLFGLSGDVPRDSVSLQDVAASIQTSKSYSNLPKAARPHRVSWSSMGSRRPLTMASTLEGSYRPASTALSRPNTPIGVCESVERYPIRSGVGTMPLEISVASSCAGPYERLDIPMPLSRNSKTAETMLQPELESATQCTTECGPAVSAAENH